MGVFSQLNVNILNHLLNQQPWSKDQLCQHHGKTLKLAAPLFSLGLKIESNGEFSALEAYSELDNVLKAEFDAIITLSPTAALRLAMEGKLDTSQLRIEGDAKLATEVGHVLRSLSWDIEDDLSNIVGDIPAHQISKFSKRALTEGKRQLQSSTAMLAEFWQEEDPLIAKRRHIEQFAAEVDTLREDAERLAKRVAKLAD